jgi:GMP synthase (glutamine-hydrolysing) A subunit
VKTSERPTYSRILILDFGSQYTQVIARRIRECQVYSEIIRFDTPAADIAAMQPKGLILSGGPASVYDKGAPQVDPGIFSLGIPILGICYGLMLMAHHLDGRVVFTGRREYGAGLLHMAKRSELFDGLGNQLDVWNSHGDEVTALPKGFRVVGTTVAISLRSRIRNANFTACNFIPKSRTHREGKRSCKISSITFVTARWTGRWARSSKKLARTSVNKSATIRSCSV